jgi:hypothetical protein
VTLTIGAQEANGQSAGLMISNMQIGPYNIALELWGANAIEPIENWAYKLNLGYSTRCMDTSYMSIWLPLSPGGVKLAPFTTPR